MLKNGRISVCGITTQNVEYIASCIKDVVETIEENVVSVSAPEVPNNNIAYALKLAQKQRIAELTAELNELNL